MYTRLKDNKKSLYYQLEKLEEEKIFTFELKNNESFSFNIELLNKVLMPVSVCVGA